MKLTRFFFILPLLWTTQGIASNGLIKQATQQCEAAVLEHCMNTTCPAYCNKINERLRNKGTAISECREQCTAENRCALKPLGGNDTPGNRELDAQNREQLIACIAEVRDPAGTKSGRRMERWQDIKTPSWQKLFSN